MKKRTFKGFTLVELIIVITILAILSTIGFLSFQGYSKNSRDSNRLSTLNVLEKGLSLNQVKTSKTILPDDNTQVLASGSLMGYEGIVGENVSRVIELNGIPKDPLTQENYIYYTNKDRNKVQLMGFVEGDNTAYLPISRANAAGTGSKIPKVLGERLGILLDVNNNRVTGTSVDILQTNSGTIYTTYFSNTDTLTSSGKELFSNLYNRRSDLLKDTSLASLDDSLVGYWDMETTTLSGGIVFLKDFSKNKINLLGTGGIIIGGNEGIIGKSTLFNGNNDLFGTSSLFNLTGPFSYSLWVKSSDLISNPARVLRQFDDGSVHLYFHSGNLSFTTFNTSGGSNLNSFGFVGDDKWHLINYTFNNNEIKIYKDGVYKGNSTLTGSYRASGSNIFRIGSHRGISEFYKGQLDEVRIYNRVLSDSEIQNLYNLSK